MHRLIFYLVALACLQPTGVTSVCAVEPDRITRVDFDDAGHMLQDDIPTFPLVIYVALNPPMIESHPGAIEARLDDLASSPFNILINYADPVGSLAQRRRYLDEVSRRGLHTIISLKDYYADGVWGQSPYLRGRSEEQAIREDVKEVADHPAVLGWYLSDEETDADAVRSHHEWVKDADPLRFTLVLSNLPTRRQIAPFADACDVLSVDPYPIGNGGVITDVAGHTDELVAATGGQKPAWVVLQAYGGYQIRKDYRDIPGAKLPIDALRGRGRPPTPREMRAMAYLALAHGATGLVIYYDKDIQSAIDRDIRWEAVKQIGHEVNELSPILLAPDISSGHLRSDNDRVHWRAKRVDNDVALVAVNSEPTTQGAKLTLPVGVRTATLLSGEALVYAHGNELLLMMDGYEGVVAMLELEEDFDWSSEPTVIESAEEGDDRSKGTISGGYWRFEEESGAVHDAMVPQQQGAVRGKVATAAFVPFDPVPGAAPGAGAANERSMEFFGDPASSLIMDAVDELNPGTADFTFEAWFYPRSADNRPVIAGKHISGWFEDKGFELQLMPASPTEQGEERYTVFFDSSSSDRMLKSEPLTFNAWHHVAVSRHGSQIMMYIDGHLVESVELLPPGDLTSKQRFSIGCSAVEGKEGGPMRQFDGYIDEVRLTIGRGLNPSDFLWSPTRP